MTLFNNAGGNETFAKELYRKLWMTKGSRFNAHQRLMSKHNWSIAGIAFSSAYVIIITLVGYIPLPLVNSQKKDVMAFSAIVLSLFILVLSLLEASKSYQMKAREFHDCARKLSPLYAEIRQILALDSTSMVGAEVSNQLAEIFKKYDDILDQCQENHETVDFDSFKIQNNNEFHIRFCDRILIQIRSWFNTFLPYLIMIVIPPVG